MVGGKRWWGSGVEDGNGDGGGGFAAETRWTQVVVPIIVNTRTRQRKMQFAIRMFWNFLANLDQNKDSAIYFVEVCVLSFERET